MKKLGVHFLNGFCYSIAITLCIDLVVLVVTGKPVMLPEFVSVLWNDQPEKREGTASESIRCPWEFMRIAGAIFEEWKGGGL